MMISPLQQTLFDLAAPTVDDNCEWYTPAHIIEAARAVMGGIDLDPASCDEANRVVKATTFYTKEQDGLQHEWKGRVWLNPPYGRGVVEAFTEKLLCEVPSGSLEVAIILTNACTDTAWWQSLFGSANARCFLRGRLRFWGPQERGNSPTQGQTVMLICGKVVTAPYPLRFHRVFDEMGVTK